MLENETLALETRLVKTEMTVTTLNEDIKEIKKSIRWLTGIIFSLNSTIIGLLAKGFNII